MLVHGAHWSAVVYRPPPLFAWFKWQTEACASGRGYDCYFKRGTSEAHEKIGMPPQSLLCISPSHLPIAMHPQYTLDLNDRQALHIPHS